MSFKERNILLIQFSVIVTDEYTGFASFFEQKIHKDFSKTFKDTFPTFQGLLSVQKRALSLCLFQFFHNKSNFILKVFPCSLLLGTWESGLDKVSTEIQGLSSTDCNFQGLSRPWIFILKFKDYQRLLSCVQTMNIDHNISLLLHVVFCRWWGQDRRITYSTLTERFVQELWSITAVQTTEMTWWLHNNFSFSFLHAQFSEKLQGKWTSKTAVRVLNIFKTLLWYKSEYRLWTIVVYFFSDFCITMISSDWRKSLLTAVKMS